MNPSTNKIISALKINCPGSEALEMMQSSVTFLFSGDKDLPINSKRLRDKMKGLILPFRSIYAEIPYENIHEKIMTKNSKIGIAVNEIINIPIYSELKCIDSDKKIDGETKYKFIMFFIYGNHIHPVIINPGIITTTGKIIVEIPTKDSETFDIINRLMQYSTHTFFENLNVLMCNNVSAVHKKIPNSVNRKRIKKKKQPLISYYILEIKQNINRIKSKYKGIGTPKRVHIRRGHIRICQSGKRTWVTNCIAGRGDGTIVKDYKI